MMCTRRKNKGSAGDRGFSLLELLLSLALLSVVLAAVYSTFSLSHSAMKGLDDSLLRLQESRMALDVMARETESSLWKPGSKKHVFRLEDRDNFGKQTSRFTFTAFTPLGSGISLISYYVKDTNGILTLYKETGSPYRPESERQTVEIIEGVSSFSVEALHDSQWLRTWDSEAANTMPSEVRITITSPVKDRPLTLQETVRPKIGKPI